jgi:anion-transporting  ArsA/GET3 family ATPase
LLAADAVALQRVVLLSVDPATGLISLRHYTISTALTHISLTHSPLSALLSYRTAACGAAVSRPRNRPHQPAPLHHQHSSYPHLTIRLSALPSYFLTQLQRVVLLSVDPATGLISLRHYTISTAPSGVKKSLKALMARQALPDLGGLQDVSELLTKSGYGSVS